MRCAAEACAGEPFYVLLGDVLVPDNKMLPAMKAVSDAHGGASVIAVMPVPDDEVSRFGVIAGAAVADDVWKVDSLVEKPALEDAPSNLAVFGRYLLSPRVMELLADVQPGVGGEIQLTDAMKELARGPGIVAVDFTGTRYDMGSKLGVMQAGVETALRHPEIGESFRAYLKELAATL